MRYLNERGFLLVFVLMITSILLLVGLSTIILTLDNYNVKKINSISKKNFYIAEAATEEALTLTHNHVKESLDYSYETLSSKKDPNIKDSHTEEFKLLYKSYMNLLIDKLKDIDSYKLHNEDTHFKIDAVLTHTSFLTEDKKEREGFILKTTATCDKSDITQVIETEYYIYVPNYMETNETSDLIFKKSWVNNNW